MTKDPIQEIKDLANIAELIAEVIPVRRSGAGYLALCPFHNDKKPSMHISPSKGIFKCFSCGAGGDVFKFWSEYYQKDFSETLKDLANKYGVILENNYSKEDTKSFNKKIQILEAAANFFHEQLLASQQAQNARDYLAKRNITTATINNFKIGYSPEEPDRLIKFLKESLDLSEEELVESGLALKNENTNSYFDRFRSRLMIPVFDERSRVIAFGGRILDPNSQLAKYINSPETSVYNKGSNLFGLNLAKEEIRKKDSVILVEGYFDLIALYQTGFTNVVANQGTALTAKQVKLMTKYTESKKILLCLDSDRAGEEASDRAWELISTILKDIDHEIRIIKIPDGKDPDDFLKTHSREEFESLINNAPAFLEYKINQVIRQTDLKSIYAKTKAIKDLAKYFALITNKILFSEYRKILATKLVIDETALAEQLNKAITIQDNPYLKQEERRNTNIIQKEKQKSLNIEEELIALFLKDKNYIESFLANSGVFTDKIYQEIFDKVLDISYENPDIKDANYKFQLLLNSLSEKREFNESLSGIGLKLELDSNVSNIQEYFSSLFKRLKETKLKNQISEIKELISSLDDENKIQKMLEKTKLEKELHSLKI